MGGSGWCEVSAERPAAPITRWSDLCPACKGAPGQGHRYDATCKEERPAATRYEPVVLIRPDPGPFVFNTEDRGTDEALTEANSFADELRAVIQRWLPWNQVAMGPFAWVELREEGCARNTSVDERSALIARCEELEGALMRIATPKRPDDTYNLSREACEQIAKEALRRADT